MKSSKAVKLPHLEKSIPECARGYTSSFYSIALEGWRRGLTLKFINENRRKSEILYELSSREKSHKFIVSRGDLTDVDTMRICRNKDETKEYLIKSKVPTPEGDRFTRDIPNEDIINYANKKGYPLVIKPVDGTGGKGVIAGIKTEDSFKKSLSYVRDKLGYRDVIVEDYFEGEDYRVYVVDKEVIAITKRIPANVIGDGKKTIENLISEKNKARKNNPILSSSLIKIDQELHQMLKQKKYTLDTIPSENEIVYLKSKNNISAGGDPIDITDEVSEEIKQIAIDGVKAIPNLPNAGVDLMVNLEKNTATVIEINTQASIRTHLFPMSGTARDVPKKIIDYYFPETKDKSRNESIYFKYGPIWNKFRDKSIKEYTLPTIPSKSVQLTRFIITGQVQNVNYGAWIRRQARDLKLNGYVRHLKNNQTSVVISGEKQSIEKFRVILKTENSKQSHVIKIEEKNRTTPILLGFEIKNPESDRIIKDGYYPVRLEGISKLGRYKKRKSNTKSKSNIYKKELNEVYSSRSWKVTKPLRRIGELFKR